MRHKLFITVSPSRVGIDLIVKPWHPFNKRVFQYMLVTSAVEKAKEFTDDPDNDIRLTLEASMRYMNELNHRGRTQIKHNP